jgi:hypothetical protein
VLSRLIAAVLLSATAISAAAIPSDGHRAVAVTDTTVPVEETASPATTDNPFLPEDANIGDCISAVPRPDCGSKARGGWRQGLVFGVVAAAVLVIGARLVIGIRRRERQAG